MSLYACWCIDAKQKAFQSVLLYEGGIINILASVHGSRLTFLQCSEGKVFEASGQDLGAQLKSTSHQHLDLFFSSLECIADK